MYLLHWRGIVPLDETIECMEELKASGKIKRWGVSNMDIDDMFEITHAAKGSMSSKSGAVPLRFSWYRIFFKTFY